MNPLKKLQQHYLENHQMKDLSDKVNEIVKTFNMKNPQYNDTYFRQPLDNGTDFTGEPKTNLLNHKPQQKVNSQCKECIYCKNLKCLYWEDGLTVPVDFECSGQEKPQPKRDVVYIGSLNMKTGEAKFAKPQKGDAAIRRRMMKALYPKPQQKESWQERYRNLLGKYGLCGTNLSHDIRKLITELLDNQRQEIVKEIEKLFIRKMPAFPPKVEGKNIGGIKLFSLKDIQEIINKIKL